VPFKREAAHLQKRTRDLQQFKNKEQRKMLRIAKVSHPSFSKDGTTSI